METRVEKGLPIDWRERIQGKKVIFYNTSISNLLNGGDKHIAKIAQVLETFRTQRDVVLWWRPHPLELSTVESMRPDLARKYTAIRKQYEEEGWGILDTSADVHRAIAISDAYYGDWSSVIHLYRVTGKPIMLSNDEAEDETNVEIMDILYYKGKLWFTAWNFNCLFSLNVDGHQINMLGEVPCNGITCSQMYNEILLVDNCLLLIPATASSIEKYDIDKRIFKELSLNSQYSEKSKYISGILDREYCYMLSTKGENILKYHLITNTIEKIIPLELQPNRNTFCKRRMCKDDQCFYFVCKNGSSIGKYNMSDDKVAFWGFSERLEKINFVELFGDLLFVVFQTYIALVDKKSGKLQTKVEFPPDFYQQEIAFIDYVRMDNIIYLMPYYSNMIIKVNMEKKSACEVKRYENINSKDFPQYLCASMTDNIIYAYSRKDKCIHKISEKGIEKIELKLNKIEKTEHMLKCTAGHWEKEYIQLRNENGFYNLKFFLDDIKKGNALPKSKDVNLCGGVIYKAL